MSQRRAPRRVKRRFGRGGIVALVLLAVALARWLGSAPAERPSTEFAEGQWRLVRVVDGDTLIVARPGTEPIRLRLLGVDTPETVKQNHPIEAWGPEASQFTEQFLRDGDMRVEMGRRQVDQYGRSLAYVYVDQRMLNVELVRAGLARVSVFPGDSQTKARLLREAEEEARRAGLGIWSSTPPRQ